MPLAASTQTVKIPGNGTTGSVSISWDYPFDIVLYESLRTIKDPDSYILRPDTQRRIGGFTKTLSAGAVYTVRAFNGVLDSYQLADEGLMREAKVGEVVVRALKEKASLIVDQGESVGGTYYRQKITTGPDTIALLEIGQVGDISADAVNFKTMANPLLAVPSFSPSKIHKLSTDNLTKIDQEERLDRLAKGRVILVTVMDGSGKWDQIERSYQLKLQQLNITFEKVDARSIGEPSDESEGEIRYRFEAWDRRGGINHLLNEWVFFNNKTTVAPFNVEDFVPGGAKLQVGPRLANAGTVFLLVDLREDDDPPFSDEFASNLRKFVNVKHGEVTENEPLDFAIRASQEPDPLDPENELDVDVFVSVKVTHHVPPPPP